MDKRIYFLINQELNKRNLKRFSYLALKRKGWKVSFFNFFYKPNKKSLRLETYVKKNIFSIMKVFFSIHKNTFYCDITQRTFYEILLQFLLKFKNCKRFTINIGNIPSVPKSGGITFSKFLKKIVHVFLLPTAEIAFTSGSIGRLKEREQKSKKIIDCHNLDYDFYLENKKNLKKNIITYIDQDFGNSIDFKMENIFFQEIKKFNLKIENFLKKMNKIQEVIVAGNPRRKVKRKLFKTKTVYGQINLLIKKSSLIITHNSTTAQLAVLYKKPLLYIYTDETKKIDSLHLSSKSFAKELGLKLHNIKKISSKQIIKYKKKKINLKKYTSYVKKYIKTSESSLVKSNIIIENEVIKYIE